MKIIYNNDIIKAICRDNKQELNVEKIIKYLNGVLGNKIKVLFCIDEDYYHRIIMIQNMSNGLISKITIGYSQDDELNVKGVVNYLVTVAQIPEGDSYELSETYVVNKYSLDKAYDSCRNITNRITVKCREFNSTASIYTVSKGDIECSFLLKNPDIDIVYDVVGN